MQGIYQIKNILNNKRYIGASNNISRRRHEHFSKSSYMTKTTVLSRALRKYGTVAFAFDIIEVVGHSKDIPSREMYWIEELKPEYNMCDGGGGCCGRDLSDSTKEKLRKSGKKQWHDLPEHKKTIVINNLTGPRKGHSVSEKTRQKLRDHNLGKKQSLYTIKKRSLKMKIAMLGNKNGNKPVCSILDGVVFKKYNSIKDAAKDINRNESGITSVLKGRQKTCCEFGWIYSN